MRSTYCDKTAMNHVLALLSPENRLAVEISIATGLRIDDVLALKVDAITKDRYSVLEKKTGKKRVIRLSRDIRKRCAAIAGDVYIFTHRDNGRKHRTRQAVWKDMKRAAVALRFDGSITPHSARKIFAVNLYRQTGSIDVVRRALNHSHAEVTYIYALADSLGSVRPKKKQKIS